MTDEKENMEKIAEFLRNLEGKSIPFDVILNLVEKECERLGMMKVSPKVKVKKP